MKRTEHGDASASEGRTRGVTVALPQKDGVRSKKAHIAVVLIGPKSAAQRRAGAAGKPAGTESKKGSVPEELVFSREIERNRPWTPRARIRGGKKGKSKSPAHRFVRGPRVP